MDSKIDLRIPSRNRCLIIKLKIKKQRKDTVDTKAFIAPYSPKPSCNNRNINLIKPPPLRSFSAIPKDFAKPDLNIGLIKSLKFSQNIIRDFERSLLKQKNQNFVLPIRFPLNDPNSLKYYPFHNFKIFQIVIF